MFNPQACNIFIDNVHMVVSGASGESVTLVVLF